MSMQSQNVEQLIDIYCSAWSEPDEAKRESVLRSVWAEGATYVDPLIQAHGTQELAAMISQVLARHPGSRYERRTGIDSHHDFARFGWRHTGPDGDILREGYDFLEFDAERKIRRIVGFFDAPPQAA